MAIELNIWTRIFTNYRAVAHILEGLTLLVYSIWRLYSDGKTTINISLLVAGIVEWLKAFMLLRAITKGSVTNFTSYLIVSFLKISARIGFVIFRCISIRNNLLSVAVLAAGGVLYFTYEFILFHYVVKYREHVKNSEDENTGRSFVWTPIFTDFRGVFHFATTAAVIYIVVSYGIHFGINTVGTVALIYGFLEFFKGYLLLRGIRKKSNKTVFTYLILSAATIITVTILASIAICNLDSKIRTLQIVLFSFEGIYIIYEILLLFFVFKLYSILKL